MTARTGMANPILHLREMAQAGTSDYTLGTVNYFTDQHLQDVLDQYRCDLYRVPLEDQSTYDGSGTAKYFDYYFEGGCYEEGTAQFIVATSIGSAVTPTTIEYQQGHMSFGTVNQMGTAYYLTARWFDLNAVAAHVWRQKAASVAMAYDFNADGQSMSRSQLKKHYQEMASLYASQARPMTATMVRG